MLDDLGDCTISTPANGNILSYNGTQWVNSNRLTTVESDQTTQNNDINTLQTDVGDLQTDLNTVQNDVDNLEPWVTNLESNFPLPLNNLSDVSISVPQNGDALTYNGVDTWINQPIPREFDNLLDV